MKPGNRVGVRTGACKHSLVITSMVVTKHLRARSQCLGKKSRLMNLYLTNYFSLSFHPIHIIVMSFSKRKRRTEDLTNCSLQVNVLLVGNSEGEKRNGLEVIFLSMVLG